jgi:hypothetical protein
MEEPKRVVRGRSSLLVMLSLSIVAATQFQSLVLVTRAESNDFKTSSMGEDEFTPLFDNESQYMDIIRTIKIAKEGELVAIPDIIRTMESAKEGELVY